MLPSESRRDSALGPSLTVGLVPNRPAEANGDFISWSKASNIIVAESQVFVVVYTGTGAPFTEVGIQVRILIGTAFWRPRNGSRVTNDFGTAYWCWARFKDRRRCTCDQVRGQSARDTRWN